MRQQKSLVVSYGKKLYDLGVALVEAVEKAGGTDDDVCRVFKDRVLRAQLGLLIMGKLKLDIPSYWFVPHLITPGLRVIEDVEPSKVEHPVFKVLSPLQKGDNDNIDGKTIRQRAKKMEADLGLSDVPTLLGLDNKGLTLPLELRKRGVYVNLTGTLLQDSKGNLYIGYLSWVDTAFSFVLNFRQIDDHLSFDTFDRLISLK